jgi:hypothetical protein
METPSAIFRLPREIIDMITDFLSDDKIALANMSLVCKAFLPSARHHLFETLTIATDRFWLLSAPVSEIVDTFTSFGPLVHHLQFRNHEKNLDLEKWIRVFLPCLSPFNGVRSLSLPGFGWRNPADARNKLFACFSGISELCIVYGFIPDASNVVRLALQFPLLEQLELEGINFPGELIDHNKIIPNDVRAFSSLGSLTISGDIGPIISWLLSLERIPSLHTLRLPSLTADGWESAGRFIRALAPTLKHLTLDFFTDTSFLQSASLNDITQHYLKIWDRGHPRFLRPQPK